MRYGRRALLPCETTPELSTTAAWRAELRRARAAAGLSQAQVADRVATSQNVISLLESGRVTSSSFVLPICHVLGIAPPTVLEDEQLERWVAAGRELRSRDPDRFARMLADIDLAV
jgi:transcriptional regulator with XRE-family HTH domain